MRSGGWREGKNAAFEEGAVTVAILVMAYADGLGVVGIDGVGGIFIKGRGAEGNTLAAGEVEEGIGGGEDVGGEGGEGGGLVLILHNCGCWDEIGRG